MSAAFTPGPWGIYKMNSRSLCTTKDRQGFWRCVIMAGSEIVAEARGVTAGDAEANARLIAAAPELYEALEAVLSFPTGKIMRAEAEARRKAFDALAKARGEA